MGNVQQNEEVDTRLSAFIAEQSARVRKDIAFLAARLAPDGPGLRPVSSLGKAKIKKSLFDYGLMPEYPILRDQYGRILSGRHRMEVEKELKIAKQWDDAWPPTWPASIVLIDDDRQAIGIAMASNHSRPWTRQEIQNLERKGLGSTKRSTLRRLIELALLENAQRTNHEIANLVGCSTKMVDVARAALEAAGMISKFIGTNERVHVAAHDRRKPSPRPITPEPHPVTSAPQPTPRPGMTVTVQFSPEEANLIRYAAETQGRSYAETVRHAVLSFLSPTTSKG